MKGTQGRGPRDGPSQQTAIQVKRLSKQFVRRSDGKAIVSIHQLDLSVPCGQVLFVVGPTGCGKSTFLNLLAGLELPTSGQVLVDGEPPDARHDSLGDTLGIIFQQDRLLPWRTASQNVELGLELSGIGRSQRTRMAGKWLDRLGLEGFADSYPRELSGGMRQRVAMARTFALEPRILLGDEVFSQLDEVTSQKLGSDFHRFAREQQMTVVLVTHQLDEAIQFGDRIVVMGKRARVLLDVSRAAGAESETALRQQIEAVLYREDAGSDQQTWT